jgi:hypothetical protein
MVARGQSMKKGENSRGTTRCNSKGKKVRKSVGTAIN